MLHGMAQWRDLSQATLEHLRRETAGPQPMPAGVAIAAVSASFALALIAKVLAVSARHDVLPEHTGRLGQSAATAQAVSQRLLQRASDDTAAFEAYLSAKRLPHSTEVERQAWQEAIRSALHRTIDVPLTAAQEAAAGLQLCADISGLVPLALIADVGVATALLSGALRGFLLCAQSNVRQLAADAAAYRERLATETRRHEQAIREADAALEHARTALQATAVPVGEP
jgi:formiminotetrahydrofolate cyclodeaminase